MEKTVYGLGNEISVIVLSLISILFSFLTTYGLITSMISFVLIILKAFIFLLIPLLTFVLEKKSFVLKRVAGIYTSYYFISMIFAILVSISYGGIMFEFSKTIFDFLSLIILLSSLFIMIEQFLIYNGIKSKVYFNVIMRGTYFVGDFISYPFVKILNNKINKKKGDA